MGIVCTKPVDEPTRGDCTFSIPYSNKNPSLSTLNIKVNHGGITFWGQVRVTNVLTAEQVGNLRSLYKGYQTPEFNIIVDDERHTRLSYSGSTLHIHFDGHNELHLNVRTDLDLCETLLKFIIRVSRDNEPPPISLTELKTSS